MIEQDTRFTIDSNLINKGWILDINNKDKNVFFESSINEIIDNPKLKKSKLRPDYVLIDSNRKPIGVIEAKAGGKDLEKALDQATEYAEILNAPLIFAMNNGYCQTRHLKTQKPLIINENEVTELIRQKEALKFLQEDTNEIYTIDKNIIVSRHELISLFKNLNNTLRAEGLRAGIERLTEFANILFLKLYTENKADNIWHNLKNTDNVLLMETFKSSLKHIEDKYKAEVFSTPQINNPDTLKDIILKLDKLTLSTIEADIKGDSFEYFLRQATATNNDLGEYFTPRHIVKSIVNLVNPKFKETIYDPFCGTGGFLTEAFNHIKDNTIIDNKEDEELLRMKTIYGGEITTNARLAKMNMILHGDGHSGVNKIDSLANPIDGKYDIVITNMPFSQKITKKVWNEEKKKNETKNLISPIYYNSKALDNGDGVCMLHCLKAVKKGGRLALIVPEGVLFKKELKETRKFLMDKAVLKTIVSLPQGVFLPYTGVKSSILYFTDCHQEKTKKDIWYFNVKNDGYTLDNNRKKIDKNDLKKIDYVNFDKIIESNDILDIGFSSLPLERIKENNYDLRHNQYIERTYQNDAVLLSEIIDMRKGKKPSKYEDIIDDTIPYLNISFLEGKKTKFCLSKNNLVHAHEDDILIVADGQRSGLTFLNLNNGIVGSTFYILDNKRKDIIDNVYLYLFIKEQYSYLNSNMYGSAIPHLDKKLFQNLRIPIINIKEQYTMRDEYKKMIKKQKEIKSIEKRLQNKIQNIQEKEELPQEFLV